jgi:hypothetical protein
VPPYLGRKRGVKRDRYNMGRMGLRFWISMLGPIFQYSTPVAPQFRCFYYRVNKETSNNIILDIRTARNISSKLLTFYRRSLGVQIPATRALQHGQSPKFEFRVASPNIRTASLIHVNLMGA